VANEHQQNDMAQQPDESVLPVAADPGLSPRGASRRRFARAGAGVTGVLATLASHPGMACSVYQAPSGWHSATTAKAKGLTVSHTVKPPSSGLPPSTWYSYGSSRCAQGLAFGSVFRCNWTSLSLKYETLHSVCGHQTKATGDKAKIAALLAAAYLNVSSGLSPFLTREILHNIWLEFQRSGTYSPTGGVTWNAVTIAAYLSGTMD
jgi:hypothetical protein